MKIYSATNIVIIVLIATALALGILILFQKNQAVKKAELPPSIAQENVEDVLNSPTVEFGDTAQNEFGISVNENTQIFGIAKENPYYGEPPAATVIGGETEAEVVSSFEIWGDVASVDFNDNVISISTDAPRPINTPFTPRGPIVSLQDIKVGDRIVASGVYDENGEADYSNIQFIQISPSLEEIKLLRETKNNEP
ncbi:MAG: hypothetical protein O3A36_04160 [bacterium]|nr:hypothetical protein [bacterium]